MLKEAGIMKKLKHRNVVRLYCTIDKECPGGVLSTVAIVMEKCDGTLSDMISAHKVYDLKTVSYLFRQIVEALDFIHEEGILHRYKMVLT